MRLVIGVALAWVAFAADCPVTAALNPPFVVPAPNQPIPDAPDFWYGTEHFWTILRTGQWRALPHNDRGYRLVAFTRV